jgi:hypothetical protein
MNSWTSFLDDTGGDQTFDNTDINITTDRITVTAHGFGATNDWINLRFTQGTASLPGITDNFVFQCKIIDANTISTRELISGTIYHGFSIDQGSGTGHKLTPQFVYSNTTSIGAFSEPTKSNQVVLGDGNVTEVTTAGTYVSEGFTVATLPTGVTGARTHVTDATATTFYSTVAGGGSNIVPVFYTGTNWVIA